MEGLEPPLPFENQILSLARLPVPPHRHADLQPLMTIALPELDICSGAISSSRRYKYVKALDNRKHEIRGLWRRLDRYYAWITVEDDAGRKSAKWVPLNARTTVEARQELDAVKLERKEHRLRHIGRCPAFADYLRLLPLCGARDQETIKLRWAERALKDLPRIAAADAGGVRMGVPRLPGHRVQDGRAGRLPEMRGHRARCEGACVAGKPPADGVSRSPPPLHQLRGHVRDRHHDHCAAGWPQGPRDPDRGGPR